MTSVRNVIKFPMRKSPARDYEAAFLPAALEIVESPASPTARAIGATIVALFCAALAWASFGSVDIVAIAPGKFVPAGRTKLVQPLEAGVVRGIHIRDGSVVRAGDILIELDPTISTADVKHVKGDLIAAKLDLVRLHAALAGHDNPLDDFDPLPQVPEESVETQRQLLLIQTQEHRVKIAEIDHQIAQKDAERQTIAATVAKLEATVPLLQERVDLRKYLYEGKLGSKINYLSELQDLVSQQQERLVQQSRQREAEAAIATMNETRLKIQAEYRRALLDDSAKAEQKAAGLTQEVIKAEQKAKLGILTAPIDGVVQQLAVHTIGGVVTPAQTLAVIVAADGEVEIEAAVSNRDIGFVLPGQRAEVKIDTFNFTRYGLVHGRVVSVSRDAITPEKARDQPFQTDRSANEPRGQEPGYAARIALDSAEMRIDGKLVQFFPGMAVTAEIKTGSRRILSYLLSPLTRYRHDVLRER
ncbi:MAG: HlyD family type I secretion periplasmic adaptor subunit [Bradyrhizobium sp.]